MAEVLLNADELFDSAAKKYRLEKYADDTLRHRFSLFIDSFNENGAIPDWALPAANIQLSAVVRARLELARDRDIYPEIAAERVERPFFVVGSARTGSTVMQTLLALGDGCRTPLFWDVWNPSPPPGLDPASDRERIATEDEFMRDLINVCPGLLLSHPYFDTGGLATVEDEELFTIDFSMPPTPMHFSRVPNVPLGHHKSQSELIDALRFHKSMLQNLQWKRPTTHWVCKTTQHFFQLPAAWEVYPDAMMVFTHRDPVVFVASLLALMQHLYSPMSGKSIYGDFDFINEVVDTLEAGYDAVVKADWPDDERVTHVRFDDFVRDHVGTIRHIYECNNLAFSPEYENRMRQWAENPANKSDRHGKFVYSLEQFGLKEADIRKRFSGYYDRFLT